MEEILKYEYGFSEGFVTLSVDKKVFTKDVARGISPNSNESSVMEDYLEKLAFNILETVSYSTLSSNLSTNTTNHLKDNLGIEVLEIKPFRLDPFEFKLIKNEE